MCYLVIDLFYITVVVPDNLVGTGEELIKAMVCMHLHLCVYERERKREGGGEERVRIL